MPEDLTGGPADRVLGQLSLAAGEVVVDRAAGRAAVFEHVGERGSLSPRAAMREAALRIMLARLLVRIIDVYAVEGALATGTTRRSGEPTAIRTGSAVLLPSLFRDRTRLLGGAYREDQLLIYRRNH